MTERGSTGAIALVVCAFAAAALMLVPQRASAETLVAVDTNGDVYEGPLGGELESLPQTEVVQAAFDGTGTLWLSVSLGGEGCYLTSPDRAWSEIAFDAVSFAPSTERRAVNGCGITTAPGAALLFDSHNGSPASSAIWRLDLSSLQASLVHGGSSGRRAPTDGWRSANTAPHPVGCAPAGRCCSAGWGRRGRSARWSTRRRGRRATGFPGGRRPPSPRTAAWRWSGV